MTKTISPAPLALVTGAATGIGAAIAARLAQAGHITLVSDIDMPAARKVAQKLVIQGYKAEPLEMDVADEQSVAGAFSVIAKRYGRCDVLVNNAGIAKLRPFMDVSLADWNEVMRVNLTGSLLCGQHAARLMGECGGGRIINMASISAVRASVGRTIYGVSKAAIVALTRQMAVELAPLHITVNAIAPGPIETPMAQSSHSGADRDAYVKAIPMQRYGMPDEIAGTVVFLVSSDAAYISGAVLAVDGGYLAAGLLL